MLLKQTNCATLVGSPGLVVMEGDSYLRGRGFESQHHILDGHFFKNICCQNCNVCSIKQQKWVKKRPRMSHFFKKLCQSDNFWLLFLRLRQPSTAVAWEVRERGLSGRHQEGLDRRTGVCRRSDDLSREVLQAAPRVRQTKAQGFLQGSGISVQLSFRYFSEIVIYSSEMVVPGLLVKADCT